MEIYALKTIYCTDAIILHGSVKIISKVPDIPALWKISNHNCQFPLGYFANYRIQSAFSSEESKTVLAGITLSPAFSEVCRSVSYKKRQLYD